MQSPSFQQQRKTNRVWLSKPSAGISIPLHMLFFTSGRYGTVHSTSPRMKTPAKTILKGQGPLQDNRRVDGFMDAIMYLESNVSEDSGFVKRGILTDINQPYFGYIISKLREAPSISIKLERTTILVPNGDRARNSGGAHTGIAPEAALKALAKINFELTIILVIADINWKLSLTKSPAKNQFIGSLMIIASRRCKLLMRYTRNPNQLGKRPSKFTSSKIYERDYCLLIHIPPLVTKLTL
ncbi:hypothetical protein PAAG_12395 [Paracoccidioides lutzii Pb01]|uniref:Uncharacterized protein n=1 Tax=Paracoccidioides lutzii (strain ATCC MYA-826 / Pb01) TaxID=502779 RepID=A0A0A2V438_PARBA|nr:hypothetical protein PAAG_12395 [Paracoccidioides lutzii Pb01]KGQ00925.1 hypothetical protein PAAG_12395 [Paracoccidioides lutzii Pb01]